MSGKNVTMMTEGFYDNLCAVRAEYAKLKQENEQLRTLQPKSSLHERACLSEKNSRLRAENERLSKLVEGRQCIIMSDCVLETKIRKQVLAEVREKLKGRWVFSLEPGRSTGQYVIHECVLLEILDKLGA